MHWEDLEGAGGEGGGGGIGMGNTCKPMAVSFQCMTKSTTKKKSTFQIYNERLEKWVCLMVSFGYTGQKFTCIIACRL